MLFSQPLQFLILIVSTYLCENTFSHLLYPKNKYRNKFNLERDFTLKVTNMEPDIDHRLLKITPIVIDVNHNNYYNTNNNG
jgi:hypothetical protein